MDFNARVALQEIIGRVMTSTVRADGTKISSELRDELRCRGRELTEERIAPWVEAKSLGQCTATYIDPGTFYHLDCVYACSVHRIDRDMAKPPFTVYFAMKGDGVIRTIGEPYLPEPDE